MIYKEHQPSFQLGNFIDSIWEFSNLETNETMQILPDGCSDIIINIGEAPSIFVSGIMTSFEESTFTPQTNLIGIRFKEGQLGQFTDFPIYETKNTQIDAIHLFPYFDLNTLSSIHDLDKFSSKKILLETILLQNFNQHNFNLLINSVIHFIQNTPNKINFNDLAKNHFISLRQLERKFKFQVGVTMKEFQRITRFKKVYRKITQSKNLNFSQIATQFGYHDYSHLSLELKKFTGQSISDFK